MNYLHQYLQYNQCNEAHTNYHIWSAFVGLASTIGRRVWIDYGHQWIYPQLYVVLVGPPGNRKSTAMLIQKRMLREVGGTNFAAQLESREGLIKQMAENEVAFDYNGKAKTYMPLTICVGELKDFLGVSMVNMINFTTAVWDQDYYDYKTRNKEDIIIQNPYLCILACDTPAWITANLRNDIISGGFSRRTLFVYETSKRCEIPFPSVTPEQLAAWEWCCKHLVKLQNVVGQFIWSSAARARFEKWYLYDKKDEIPKDTALFGYFDSKHIMVLKIAMLLALCEEEPVLVIEERHLDGAMGFLALAEKNLPIVFQGLGRNELNAVTNKAIELLHMAHGPMREKDLRAALWQDAKGWELDEIMKHMVSLDTVFFWDQGVPPNVRRWVCLRPFLPSHVQAALARVEESKTDASAQAGPPSALELIRGGIQFPTPVTPPSVPSPSDEGKAPSASAEPSKETDVQWPPAGK